jgi:hypothetical protein
VQRMKNTMEKICTDIETFFHFLNFFRFGLQFEKIGDDSFVSVVPLTKAAHLCYKVKICMIHCGFRIIIQNRYLLALQ